MRTVAVLSVVGVHVALAGQAVDSTLPGRLLAHLNIGVTIFFYYLVERPLLRLKYRTLHDVLRRRRGPVQTAN